jgi:hypothetical protein
MLNFMMVYTSSMVVQVIHIGVYNGLVVELGWWRQILENRNFEFRECGRTT